MLLFYIFHVITFRIDIVLILPDDEAIAPKAVEGE
jgi:hypothetical protein